eukprot:1290297-Rhodomonas_salina.5
MMTHAACPPRFQSLTCHCTKHHTLRPTSRTKVSQHLASVTSLRLKQAHEVALSWLSFPLHHAP